MIFGSISNVFNAIEGSVAASGNSLGMLLGYGGASAMDILARVFETIYSASGEDIPNALG